MPQTYTQLKNRILTELQSITKLQEVTDNPKLDFTGYPAATVTPSDQAADYETTSENERVYAFIVSVYQEIQAGGISAGLDTLYDVADDVLDQFDRDELLGGISLDSRYDILGIRPAIGGWEAVEDNDLLVLNITLRITVSVDINP
ncbi:hypothetical protein HY492_00055 [Candidatus Woesearchaeota archaeon]|nr:hypothetical protein [Candidatus Woesearchaeota archaeon]